MEHIKPQYHCHENFIKNFHNHNYTFKVKPNVMGQKFVISISMALTR